MADIKIEIVEDSDLLQSNKISTLGTDSNPSAEEFKVEFPGCDSFNRSAETLLNINSLPIVDNQVGHSDLYLCDVCELSFSAYAELANHNFIHRKECWPKCNFCESYFKSVERLKSHEKHHTKIIQDENNDKNGLGVSVYSLSADSNAPSTSQPKNNSSMPPGNHSIGKEDLIVIEDTPKFCAPTIPYTSQDQMNLPDINSSLQTVLIPEQSQCSKTQTKASLEQIDNNMHKNLSTIVAQIPNNENSLFIMGIESSNELLIETEMKIPVNSCSKLRNVRLNKKSNNATQQYKSDTIPSTSVSRSNDDDKSTSLSSNHTVVGISRMRQSSCGFTGGLDMRGRTVEITPHYILNTDGITPNRIEGTVGQRLPTSGTDKRQGNMPLFPMSEERRLHGEKFGVGRRNSKIISVRDNNIPTRGKFACNPCFLKFPTEADGNIHKIIHTGIPPLICPICCVGYIREKPFIHHLKKMTGDKPFKCAQCDMSFFRDRQLFAHISAVHINSKTATKKSAIEMAVSMNRQLQSHGSGSDQHTNKSPNENSLKLCYELADRVAVQIALILSSGKKITQGAAPVLKVFKPHENGHYVFIDLDEDAAVCVANETSRRLFHRMPTLAPSQKETVCTQTIEKSSTYGRIESQRQEETYLNPNQPEQLNFAASSQSLTRNSVDSVQSTQRPFQPNFQRNESNFDIDINSYECDSCPKNFSSETELNIHSETHKLGKLWKCEICGKCLKTERNLNFHMRRHFGIRSYSCESCAKCFVTRTELFHHRNRHHSDHYFVCVVCQKKLLTKEGLDNHMNSHDPNRELHECKQCCKVLMTKSGLRGHMEKMHSATPRTFLCQLCNKKVKNLIEHMTSHTKPLKCEKCPRKFAHKRLLENHMKRHNNDLQFCCTECGKKFLTGGKLKDHFKRHSKVNQYFCGVCDRSFFDKAVLKAHEKVHTKEKPYSCDFCARSFAHRYVMTYHIKCHLNDKRFKCKKCRRRFVDRGKLNAHKCKKIKT